MAGVDDAHFVLGQVQHGQDHRHEAVLPAGSAEGLVEPADGGRRRRLADQTVARLGGELGHQQRRRNPLPRHVAKHDCQPSVRQRDVVEVISPQLFGRLVEIEELIPFQIGGRSGEKALLDPIRYGQLPPQARLLHRDLVQLRVLDGDRRLTGHAGQHLQVVLVETLPLVHGVDLDHPQHLAFAADQRGAHHRVDLEVDDALGHVEAGVGRRVGRQNRLPAFDHPVDDRPADADLIGRFFTAVLQRLGHQSSRGLVLEHHKAAVGLQEDGEQAVQHFGQHLVELDGPAQVLTDLQDRLQLRLGVDRQPQCRRARADVHLGHHRRAAGLRLIVDHHGPVDGLVLAGHRDGTVGRPEVEDELHVADPQPVVLQEPLSPCHHLVVQESAVATVEVFDVEVVAGSDDSGVLPADRPDLQDDVAVGMASQDDRITVQREQLPGILSYEYP